MAFSRPCSDASSTVISIEIMSVLNGSPHNENNDSYDTWLLVIYTVPIFSQDPPISLHKIIYF